MVLCNNCGRIIPGDAIWCPYCRNNTGRMYLDPSSIKLGGTLGTFAISGAMSFSSHVNTPHSLYIERSNQDFKDVWMKLPDIISKAIQEGPKAVEKLNNVVKQRDRAVNITRLIGVTNSLFRSKCNAELFREDQPRVLTLLHTPCDSPEDSGARDSSIVCRTPLATPISLPP